MCIHVNISCIHRTHPQSIPAYFTSRQVSRDHWERRDDIVNPAVVYDTRVGKGITRFNYIIFCNRAIILIVRATSSLVDIISNDNGQVKHKLHFLKVIACT